MEKNSSPALTLLEHSRGGSATLGATSKQLLVTGTVL